MLSQTYSQNTLPAKYGDDQVIKIGVVLEANRQYSGPTVLGQVTAANQNCIQTIVRASTPVSGTFKVAFGHSKLHLTPSLSGTVTAAQLQAALEALPNIGKGNVVVGFATQTWTVTWAGRLANKPQPTVQIVDNTTGVVFTASTTQAGVQNGAWGPYDDNATDGRQVARGLLLHACASEPDSRVSFASTQGGSEHGSFVPAVAIALSGGIWEANKFSGMDANAAADLGVIKSGTLAGGNALLLLR